MRCKIMPVGNLENTTARMKGALALVYLLCESVEVSTISEDAGDGLPGLSGGH